MADIPDQPACVIPGCTAPVSGWGQPCWACLESFGCYLRLGAAPLTRRQIVDRDADVQLAYAAQRRTIGAPR